MLKIDRILPLLLGYAKFRFSGIFFEIGIVFQSPSGFLPVWTVITLPTDARRVWDRDSRIPTGIIW